MEVLTLAYQHPVATFFFLLAIGWAISEFHPFVTKISKDQEED